MKRPLRLVVLPIFAATVLLTVGDASRADMVLDQQLNPADFPPDELISAGFGGTQNLAQTFTVGISGTLAEVDVSIERFAFSNPTGTLFLQIRSTTGGVPADDPSYLLQVSTPESSLPTAPDYGFVRFDVSASGLRVTQGEQLAIVLLAPDFAEPVSWIGTQGDHYPQGLAFQEQASNFGWIPLLGPDADLGFRTFVTPVPEPSSLALAAIAGLLGLAYAGSWSMAGRRVGTMASG